MFNTINLLSNLSEQTASTIAIIIDVVIVVILLIFLLRGFVTGFIDAILKLIGTVGALLVAIFCARPVANFLDEIISIKSWFSGIGAGFCTGDALTTTIETEAQRQAALSAIDGSGYVSIIKSFLTNVVNSMPLGDLSVAQAVDAAVATILGIVLTGVLLFIVIKLVVFLLGKLFDAVEDKRGGKSGLDRLLGSILGLVKGAVVVVIIMIIGTFLNYAKLPVDQVMQNTYVSKPIYEFISGKVTEVIDDIDFNAIIDDIIKDDNAEGEGTEGEGTGDDNTGEENTGDGNTGGDSTGGENAGTGDDSGTTGGNES